MDGAGGVFVPSGGAFGVPEGEDDESVSWAWSVGEGDFGGGGVGELEFAEAPGAEISRVTDGTADEEALGIETIAEEAERGGGGA